jgi:hypothetical protein
VNLGAIEELVINVSFLSEASELMVMSGVLVVATLVVT